MTSVNNITARHLDHLDSLRKRHAYRLDSRVGCSEWLPNCGTRILSGTENIEYRSLRKLPEDIEEQQSNKQGLTRYVEDTYNREETCEVIREERRSVLKCRESEKRHLNSMQIPRRRPLGKEERPLPLNCSSCKKSVCVRVTRNVASGKSPADIRD